MESTETAPAVTCTRCGKNPRSNGNNWCQPCRTEHAKLTRETAEKMAFTRGAAQFRDAVAQQLARHPGSMVECHATAKWIVEFPLPEY